MWQVDLLADLVKISSTTADAVLTAEAPAPRDRMVARALDREGVPVTWVGQPTPSSTSGTDAPPNAPRFCRVAIPEVMYFALGQVSSANLHALFDRGSDTLISFPDQTTMRRNGADVLDLTMAVPGNAAIRLLPDYYVKTLGAPFYVPFDDSRFPSAPMSWGSWTTCYAEVTEQDIVSATDWLARHLKPYGFQYIMLDDGYDKAKDRRAAHMVRLEPGEISTRSQVAGGLRQVQRPASGPVAGSQFVDRRGGTAPGLVFAQSPGKIHPQLPTRRCSITLTRRCWRFCGSSSARFAPGGFDYFKLDGEFSLPAYAPDVDLSKVHDASVSAVEAYRNRMKAIRETVGPETLLEGAPEGTTAGTGSDTSPLTGTAMTPGIVGRGCTVPSVPSTPMRS